MLELKFRYGSSCPIHYRTYNRTMLELKLNTKFVINWAVEVL